MKVSVLTPIYNHSVRYVRECLQSLLAQTLQDIEFILIDNGANQESKDLIEEFLRKDSRFRALHIEKNEGYGKAMNLGLRNAQGEYIGVVESDDFVNPAMYETLYNIGKENGVDVVKCLFSFKEEGKPMKIGLSFKPTEYNRVLKNLDVPDFCFKYGSYWSAIYRREMLDRHRIWFDEQPTPSGEDIMWTLKTYFFCRNLFISHRCFYHYRVDNPNSSIRRRDDKIANCMDLYLLLNTYLKGQKYEMLDEYWYIKSRREFLNFWWGYQSGDVSAVNWRLFLKVARQLRYNLKEDHVRLGPLETRLYRRLAYHPIWVIIRGTIVARKRRKNRTISCFLGIPWKSVLNTTSQKTQSIYLGRLFCVNRDGKSVSRCLCGLTFYRRVKTDEKEVRYFFGIPFYHRSLLHARPHAGGQSEAIKIQQRLERMKDDIGTRLYAMVTHRKTFGPYLNCHTDKDVVLVACGPSAKYFSGLRDAVYIGVNRAFLNKSISLDFLFVQDDLGEDQVTANKYRPGECKKFYGIIPHVRYFECQNNPKLQHIHRISLLDADSASAKRYILNVNGCGPSFWPYDISVEPIRDAGGTVFSALQFILYTHPKRVFLVGCDCSAGGHFYGGRQEDFSPAVRWWHDFASYAKRDFREIEIISVNPSGLRGLFRDVYTDEFINENTTLNYSATEKLGNL